jgi:penicillin amidase
MVTLLKPLTSSDAQIQRGLDLLRGWDGNERADSAPAALFEIWFSKHLRTAVVRAALAPEAARLVGAGDPSRVIAVLERPDSWMSVEKRNDVMLASLKSAMVEVEKSWALTRRPGNGASFTRRCSSIRCMRSSTRSSASSST